MARRLGVHLHHAHDVLTGGGIRERWRIRVELVAQDEDQKVGRSKVRGSKVENVGMSIQVVQAEKT
jgi:hypothetical protein